MNRFPSFHSRISPVVFVAVFASLAFASTAHAATGGTALPWNTPLEKLLDNLTGPTGKTLAALMIAIGGVIWGFTRHEEGARRLGQAIVAIGLIYGAVGLITTLGFSGAIF